MYRGEGRRRRREARHVREAPAIDVPSTDEIVERLEIHRVLVEELQALEEPYRTTILLRFFQDLSSAEIARSAGLPPGTVRWRLKRGIDAIRERLDAHFGGERDVWGVGLAALVGRGIGSTADGGGSATSTTAGWLVGGLLKAGALLALVSVAGLGLWSLDLLPGIRQSSSEGSTAAAPTVFPNAGDERETGDTLVPIPPATSESRGAVPGGTSSEEPGHRVATLLVRFVDLDGRPLEGVRVRPGPLTGLPDTMSSADGRVEMIVEEASPLSLTGARPEVQFVGTLAGFGLHWLSVPVTWGETTNRGEVVLTPGALVAGRLTDLEGRAAEGIPVFAASTISGIRVRGADAGRTGEIPGASPEPRTGIFWACPSATSGPDGAFRIDTVPAGRCRLWAGGGGWRYSYSAVMDLAAGDERLGLELALEKLDDLDLIAGVVFAPDGEPVPNALVVLAPSSEGGRAAWPSNADEQGRFRLRLIRRAPHDLTAVDPAQEWFQVMLDGVAPGTLDVSLRFDEPVMVPLRVHDGEGNPIEEYRVQVFEGERRGPAGRVLALCGRSPARPARARANAHRPAGRSEIRVPPRSVELDVIADGYEISTIGPFVAGVVNAPIDCELVPLPRIRGRVTAEGRPIPGASVELLAVAAEGHVPVHEGMPSLVDVVFLDVSTTDEEGYFEVFARYEGMPIHLTPVRRDLVRLRATAEGWAPGFSSPLPVMETGTRDGIELELARAGAIEGRVLVPEGGSATGVFVSATNGDGHPRSARAGEDGRYRIEGLTEGDWFVSLVDSDEYQPYSPGLTVNTPFELPVSCRVRPGETTLYDLDLGRSLSRLDGRLSLTATDVTGWVTTLQPLDASARLTRIQTTSLDRHGRFRFEFVGGGVFHLTIRGGGPTDEGLRISDVVELHGDPVDWRLDLELVPLAVSNSPPDLHHLWRGGRDLEVHRILVPEQGVVSPTRVPAGPSRLVRRPPDGTSTDPASWPVVKELVLLPGESHSVRL